MKMSIRIAQKNDFGIETIEKFVDVSHEIVVVADGKPILKVVTS